MQPLRILTFLFLAALLQSCGAEQRVPGYVYLRLNANPTTLDPALVVDVTGGAICAKLFNGLVRLAPDLSVMPDLASSWEVKDHGLEYVFHLRSDVRFSNGRPVTAEDVRYSFLRLLSPSMRSPNSWVLAGIAGAGNYAAGRAADVDGLRVVDSHTLVIRLREPFAPFLNLLTMPAAYIVSPDDAARLGTALGSHPSGTGPFVLESWSQNSRVVLARNDAYFDAPARVRGIEYRVIPEDLTAVAEFEVGNLDVLSLPAAELARFRADDRRRGHILHAEGLNIYYLGFNCSRPPFSDAALRRRAARAIDRQKMLATFYEGRGRLASGPVPDLLRNWNAPEPPAFEGRRVPDSGRPSQVRRVTADLLVPSDQEVVDIAEIIQSYLSDAGIDVRIRRLEWSAFKSAVNNGEGDMYWLSWWADYADPENFLFPLFHSSQKGPPGNRSRYENVEVDRLLEAAQASADPKERAALYGQAEHLIVSDSPWVFFWHKTDYIAYQPRVKGRFAFPVYSMDKGTEIYL